ncbi:MAG: L-threonylcarbamoyladenylate synthase [Patescibacteria group bacterium]
MPIFLTTENLNEAVRALKDGKVIVFPTETMYGIGCDPENVAAAARISAIKNRPASLNFNMIARDKKMAMEWGTMEPHAEQISDKHWPGPLTIILHNAKKTLASECLRGNAVGVRVSDHPFMLALTAAFGKPIIATSANVHGGPSAYSIPEVLEQFKKNGVEPDIYFDGGELPPCAPSMVVEIVNGELVVHRQGSFKL